MRELLMIWQILPAGHAAVQHLGLLSTSIATVDCAQIQHGFGALE